MAISGTYDPIRIGNDGAACAVASGLMGVFELGYDEMGSGDGLFRSTEPWPTINNRDQRLMPISNEGQSYLPIRNQV